MPTVISYPAAILASICCCGLVKGEMAESVTSPLLEGYLFSVQATVQCTNPYSIDASS